MAARIATRRRWPKAVKQSMIKHLAELRNQPVTQLLDARQARLRGFGAFHDA